GLYGHRICVRFHYRPGACAHAVVVGRPVSLDCSRVYRDLSRSARAGYLSDDRQPAVGFPRILFAWRSLRHGVPRTGAGLRGVYGRDVSCGPASSAEGTNGSGALAGHAIRTGDGVDRHPAGIPDRNSSADQRAGSIIQRLVAGVVPRCYFKSSGACEVRKRSGVDFCQPHSDPGIGYDIPAHHHSTWVLRAPPRGESGNRQMTRSAYAVEVRNLHKSFGPLEVLKGIDFTVDSGQLVCIIGPTGSGKSTLLRCVNLLEEPTSGKVFVNGVELTDPDVDIDAERCRIGMVFQQFNLFPHLTVLRNVTIAQERVLKRSRAEAERIARAGLDRVGLGEKAGAFPAQLSGGQQQRVAIARALAMDPTLMLFDEPTSALDP